MADFFGDHVVAASDSRRKQYLDGVFLSHASGMPTEGDIQTPGLTQGQQAGIDPTQGSAIKPKQKPARAEKTVPADPGQPRDLQMEMAQENAADSKRQANAQSLQQDLQKKDQADPYAGREWLRPSNDPLHEMERTSEITSMAGKAALVKGSRRAGHEIGDPTKLTFANTLKRIGIPSMDEIDPNSPFAGAAMATAGLTGLALGAVADPTNFTPMGGGKKAASGLNQLGKFAKKFPAYTPPPVPTKGLDFTSVAQEAHAAYLQSGGQGITWSPSQGNMAGQNGYAVSPLKELERRIPGTATAQDFEQFIHDNSAMIAQHPDLTVGAWKSGDETVLDLTAVVPDLEQAKKLGYMSGQDAMWDLANNREIPLPKMELEHYSKQEGLTSIDPAKQGTGQGGGEMFRKMNYGDDFVERSFFYKKGTKPEHRFKGHPKYTVEVDPSRIYDMDADPLQLNKSIKDYTLREKHIKEAGYLGYTDPASYAGDKTMSRVVQLFENVRPKEAGLPELDARLAFLEETKPPFAPKMQEPVAAQVEGGQTKSGRPYERPSDFTQNDHIMAQVYDAAPTFDERAVPAWNALRDETKKMFADISKKVQVEGVPGQPYANAAEMNADIARGHFKVSTDNNEHPLWTPEENFRFRVVHDYLGHFEGNQDFSLAGEVEAFKSHGAKLSEDARKALQVEVYGQAASAVGHGGEFQPQKVFLPDFEEHAKRTGELFEDVGAEYPAKEKLGARGIGVRNNVLVNAGAAVIHRGARDMATFKKGMEQSGVIHAAGAEVNWDKLYKRSQSTYARYVDSLAQRGSKLEPVRELSKRFKAGDYLKTWYNDAREAAADSVGVGIDETTNLPDNLLLLKFVAATSPMQAVEPNIELALMAYKNHKLGQPWDARLKFNETNLNRIVAGQPFTYDAGGIKVTEFYDALSGNPDATVVDRHMMGAFGFKRVSIHPEYGSESVDYFASPKQVGFIQQLMKQEAARFKVSPREYQAAVWIGQKFKIGLQPGEAMPETFGNTLRRVVEKDPYFKYPPGMGEEGKANFAAMWMLTRMAAGAMFGGEYGDTTSDRLLNAAAGAGISLAMFSPKTIAKLTGIMMKSEAAINAERAASRAETVFKLSGTGNEIAINVGDKSANISAASLQTAGGLEEAVEQVKKARRDYAKEAAAKGAAPTVNREGSRGVITNDEARRLGALLGLDADDIMKRAAGTPHAAEEIFAYADILEGTWNHLVQLGAEVERDPANPANASALMMLEPIYRSVGNQFRGALEEAGRSLQAAGAKDVQRAKSNLELFEGGCL